MNTIFSCSDIDVFCYQLLLQFWLRNLYVLSNTLSNAFGLISFQTQDYKTFLEPLSSPNITLWKKRKIEYLFNCFIQGYDESLLYQGPKIFHSQGEKQCST